MDFLFHSTQQERDGKNRSLLGLERIEQHAFNVAAIWNIKFLQFYIKLYTKCQGQPAGVNLMNFEISKARIPGFTGMRK